MSGLISRSHLDYLLGHLSGKGKSVLVYFILSLLLTASSIAVPIVTRVLISQGISEGSTNTIIWSAVGLAAVGIVGQILSLLYQTMELSISQAFILNIRENLAEIMAWYTDNTMDTGYLISRVQTDAQSLGGFIRSVTTLINQFLLLLASLTVSWVLLNGSLYILIPMVIATYIVGAFSYRIISSRSKQALESEAIAFGRVGELISGRETLSSQGGCKRITEKVIQKQSDHVNSMKQLLFSQISLGSITGIMKTLGLALLIAWSAFRVAWGDISFGDWYAINLYGGLVLGAAVTIASNIKNLGQTRAAADRVLEITAYAEKEKNRFSAQKSVGSKGTIQVIDVSFGYSDVLVIDSLNMTVDPNNLVLITGASGSGKTTLCRLLSGQLEPEEGHILIGGKEPLPIGHISGTGTVAVLPQEVYIFNTSIIENISLGNENASFEEIVNAATLAGIHDEIDEMESHYETNPGPNGNRLSLGQKRRIALARSLLSNPEIIILDEPFASLDRENVIKLAKTLRECTQRCTVIVVSHGWEEELSADVRFELG